MASGPITSWQIDGGTVETVADFIFLGSKITADGDWSHEIERHLLLGKKIMTNLDSILKNRDISLPTKVRLVKAMVFPVVMYGCESWTVKKAERWRIDRSWVFIGRTDAEAETSILWPPDVKSWLMGKDPEAGKDWGQEEKGMTEDEMVGWHHQLRCSWVWVDSGSWWWTGRPGVLRFMGSQRVGHDWATELNWIHFHM